MMLTYKHTCVAKNDTEVAHKIKVVLGINQRMVDNDNVRQAYIVKPGDYELNFIIYSLNMRYEKESFILHFPDDNNVNGIVFHKKGTELEKNDTILIHRRHEKQPMVCVRCYELKQKCRSK